MKHDGLTECKPHVSLFQICLFILTMHCKQVVDDGDCHHYKNCKIKIAQRCHILLFFFCSSFNKYEGAKVPDTFAPTTKKLVFLWYMFLKPFPAFLNTTLFLL